MPALFQYLSSSTLGTEALDSCEIMPCKKGKNNLPWEMVKALVLFLIQSSFAELQQSIDSCETMLTLNGEDVG